MQVSILHMSMLDMYHDSHDQIMAIHKTPEMHEITHLMHNAHGITVITSSHGMIAHTHLWRSVKYQCGQLLSLRTTTAVTLQSSSFKWLSPNVCVFAHCTNITPFVCVLMLHNHIFECLCLSSLGFGHCGSSRLHALSDPKHRLFVSFAWVSCLYVCLHLFVFLVCMFVFLHFSGGAW